MRGLSEGTSFPLHKNSIKKLEKLAIGRGNGNGSNKKVKIGDIRNAADNADDRKFSITSLLFGITKGMDRKQTGKSNWDDQLSDVNDEGMQTYGLNGLSVTPQKMQVQKPPSAQAGTLQHDLEMLASENNYDNEKNPNRNTFY